MKKKLKFPLALCLWTLLFYQCKPSAHETKYRESLPGRDSLQAELEKLNVADSSYSKMLFSYWDIASEKDTFLHNRVENYGKYLVQHQKIDSLFTRKLLHYLPQYSPSSYHHALLNLAGAELSLAFLPDSAISCFDQAINLYSKSGNDSLLEVTYMQKGRALYTKAVYPDALMNLTKALEYAKRPGSSGFPAIKSYIANIYMDLKENEKAVNAYSEIAAFHMDKKEYDRAIINLSSLTNIYTQMNDTVRGLQASDRALFLSDSIHAGDYTYYTVYFSRANILKKTARKEEALVLFDRSAEIQNKLNNPYLVSRLQLFKAELQIRLKKWKEARALLNDLLPAGRQNNSDPSFLMDIYGQLSLVESAGGNYKTAFTYSSAYYRIKDSIDLKNQALNIARLEKEFETKEKDLQIQLQEAQLKAVKKEKRTLHLITAFSLALSLMIVYLVWTNRKRKIARKEAELKKKFRKDLIIATENEQSRIAMDLHDGIASDLLVLKSKLPDHTSPDARKYIDEIIHDLRSITKEIYPLQLIRSGLCYSIKDLIDHLDQLSPIFFSYEIDESLNRVLPEDKQLYLFRIIQEAFNNIIRHSKAEAAYFEISRKNDLLTVIIKDNGCGFTWHEKKDMHTIGIKSMFHRAEIIGGTLHISSLPDKGTTLKLTLPAP